MRQLTDDRSHGLGRSFIKGPRFFVKPSHQNCCERCVWGTGEHMRNCPSFNAQIEKLERAVNQERPEGL